MAYFVRVGATVGRRVGVRYAISEVGSLNSRPMIVSRPTAVGVRVAAFVWVGAKVGRRVGVI